MFCLKNYYSQVRPSGQLTSSGQNLHSEAHNYPSSNSVSWTSNYYYNQKILSLSDLNVPNIVWRSFPLWLRFHYGFWLIVPKENSERYSNIFRHYFWTSRCPYPWLVCWAGDAPISCRNVSPEKPFSWVGGWRSWPPDSTPQWNSGRCSLIPVCSRCPYRCQRFVPGFTVFIFIWELVYNPNRWKENSLNPETNHQDLYCHKVWTYFEPFDFG